MKLRLLQMLTVAALVALVGFYIYQGTQFRKPLTSIEIDELAAIVAGQTDCNWRYDSTRKGEWQRLRSVAERQVNATFQARFMAAMAKYKGLSEDEQCELLDKFPNLVRRWHD
jgi:hypothetical protein